MEAVRTVVPESDAGTRRTPKLRETEMELFGLRKALQLVQR
jgi:hypothetical protein